MPKKGKFLNKKKKKVFYYSCSVNGWREEMKSSRSVVRLTEQGASLDLKRGFVFTEVSLQRIIFKKEILQMRESLLMTSFNPIDPQMAAEHCRPDVSVEERNSQAPPSHGFGKCWCHKRTISRRILKLTQVENRLLMTPCNPLNPKW